MWIGEYDVGDVLPFWVNVHDPNKGLASDADSDPSYRIYEETSDFAIKTGTMSLFDGAGTVGFYIASETLSNPPFDRDKNYIIYISATVAAKEGTTSHRFNTKGRHRKVLSPIADRNFNNNLDALLAVLDEPYSTMIDAIWDELRSLHNVAGSFGEGMNVEEINSSSLSARLLQVSSETMVIGTVDDTAFSPTTTVFEANLEFPDPTPDHFNERTVVFTSGPLRREAVFIDDYTFTGGRSRFTISKDGEGVGGLTGAPADGATFIIL